MQFLEMLQRQSVKQLALPTRNTDLRLTERKAMLQTMAGLVQVRRDRFTAEELAKYETSLRSVLRELEEKPLPTTHECAPHYSLLRSSADQIEKAITLEGLQVRPTPVLGTLRTGRVNALTVAVPGSDEYVVLFESELFHFAYLLSKAIVAAMSVSEGKTTAVLSPSREDVIRRLRAAPEVLARFQQVLIAYAALGRPSAAPPYALAEPWATVAAQLARSVRLFVLGHEYGHLLAGYHRATKSASTLPGGARVDEYRYSWAEELEADRWGLRLMVRGEEVAGGLGTSCVDFPFCYWGADFYFGCYEVLEDSVSILSGGKTGKRLFQTHPPPEVRRASLRAALYQSFGPERAERAMELAVAVDGVLRTLWEESQNWLYKCHRSGVTVASTWSTK